MFAAFDVFHVYSKDTENNMWEGKVLLVLTLRVCLCTRAREGAHHTQSGGVLKQRKTGLLDLFLPKFSMPSALCSSSTSLPVFAHLPCTCPDVSTDGACEGSVVVFFLGWRWSRGAADVTLEW